MKINYDSCYSNNFNSGSLANQTVHWLPMDTKERYLDNLRSNRAVLELNGWIDKEITYKFNSHAFRCDEFTSDPSILFLGCSHTVGVGVPLEHTWPTIVADNLNLKCYNLGQGGGSADTAYRLGSHWIPRLLPKIVVFLVPNIHRLELIKEHDITFLTPMTPDKCVLGFYDQWIYVEANCWLNSQKNTFALEQICNLNSCKFISLHLDCLPGLDLARDLSHCGIRSHLTLADTVVSLIN
jgi:hypothetical protein